MEFTIAQEPWINHWHLEEKVETRYSVLLFSCEKVVSSCFPYYEDNRIQSIQHMTFYNSNIWSSFRGSSVSSDYSCEIIPCASATSLALPHTYSHSNSFLDHYGGGEWWFSGLVVSDFCDHMYCSPPGSSVHGILQARILEWVVISSSRGSSWPRDWTCISCLCRQIL